MIKTSIPVGLAALYVVPLMTTLPVAQIVVLSLPDKAGKTINETVTVESQLLEPTLVNTSVPVGLAAL